MFFVTGSTTAYKAASIVGWHKDLH